MFWQKASFINKSAGLTEFFLLRSCNFLKSFLKYRKEAFRELRQSIEANQFITFAHCFDLKE